MLTDLLQVDRQNLLSAGLLQVVSASCNKFTNDKLQTSQILRDFLQLDEIAIVNIFHNLRYILICSTR